MTILIIAHLAEYSAVLLTLALHLDAEGALGSAHAHGELSRARAACVAQEPRLECRQHAWLYSWTVNTDLKGHWKCLSVRKKKVSKSRIIWRKSRESCRDKREAYKIKYVGIWYFYRSRYLRGIRRAGHLEYERRSRHVFSCKLHAKHVAARLLRLHVQRECAVAVLVELAIRHLWTIV